MSSRPIKKLVLARETVRKLKTRTAIRTGLGATVAGQSTCPWPWQTTICGNTASCVLNDDGGDSGGPVSVDAGGSRPSGHFVSL